MAIKGRTGHMEPQIPQPINGLIAFQKRRISESSGLSPLTLEVDCGYGVCGRGRERLRANSASVDCFSVGFSHSRRNPGEMNGRIGDQTMTERVRHGYGLYNYRTGNVGDEIQSIAARRFLPRIDQFVDRDGLTKVQPSHEYDQLKLIMNGWYSHAPENWPPRDKSLDPLLVSMHVTQVSKPVIESFLSNESRRFLSAHGPVGTRDLATRDFFRANGIDAEFTGCMTLTLDRDERVEDGEHILLVDVPPRIEAAVRARTDRPVISATVYVDPAWGPDTKFLLAEYFLNMYQSAHAVVTTRLHTALPSTALGTPVAFIRSRTLHELSRFSGLWHLLRVYEEDEFAGSKHGFDLDEPGPNPDAFKPIRDELIDRCVAFTGFGREADPIEGPRRRTSAASLMNDPGVMGVVADALQAHWNTQFPGVSSLAQGMSALKRINAIRRAHQQRRAGIR